MGRWRMARAMTTFCRIPVDISPTFLSRVSSISKRSTTQSKAPRKARPLRP